MGVTRKRGKDRSGDRFIYAKRVPKRYAEVVQAAGKPYPLVRIALRTDVRAEAEEKARRSRPSSSRMGGDVRRRRGSARAHYRAARQLAEARDVPYVPVQDLARGDLDELVCRVVSLSDRGGARAASPAVEVLGTVPEALPSLREAFDEYLVEVASRHTNKSQAQRKKWRALRDRSIEPFLEVMGRDDMPIGEIDRDAARRFRKFWQDRVAGGYKIASANKEIGVLSDIFATWAKARDLELSNPFAGLSIEGKDESRRPSYSRAFIRDTLLAAGALDGMTAEARDVLLVLVNTGCRPSEVTDAPLEDWRLDDAVPHLRIGGTAAS